VIIEVAKWCGDHYNQEIRFNSAGANFAEKTITDIIITTDTIVRVRLSEYLQKCVGRVCKGFMRNFQNQYNGEGKVGT